MITRIQRLADFLRKVPGGFWILSRLLAITVPYSGTIRADIAQMGDGSAALTMRDRRSIRNHLHSIHALALANLGELTANLALITLCPEGGRFIVTRMDTEYVKKARGELLCTCDIPTDLPWKTLSGTAATATIVDSSGEVVTRVTIYWKLDSK